MGWKLGESANLDDMLEAQVISSVLMENSASPLMQWLESNDLGTAPSPLCGLEDSMREMVFAAVSKAAKPHMPRLSKQRAVRHRKDHSRWRRQ